MRLVTKRARIALVYDWLDTKYGGAEKLLLALHRVLPLAPLYTSIYKPNVASWASPLNVVASQLNLIPWVTQHQQLIPLLPFAFESFNFNNFDLVLSVSSAFAKGVITQPKTFHLCYLLTPTRFLWQDSRLYQSSGLGSLFSYPVLSHLRVWDQVAAERPDAYLTISQGVAQRLKKYYRRSSDGVLPPPIETDLFTLPPKPEPIHQRTYFLIVARLVPYKRIEIAIEAFNRLKYPLVIVGTGSEESRLRKLALPNIKFVRNVNQGDLISLYQRARALLVTQEEDFGLAGLEANACGTPVVALRRGEYCRTLSEGISATFYDSQTCDALIQKLTTCDFSNFSSDLCRREVLKFGFGSFRNALLKHLSGHGIYP